MNHALMATLRAFASAAVFGLASASLAMAAEPAAPASAACAVAPPAKSGAKERFEGMPLMIIADALEKQGESNFHLKYAAPASQCTVETFVAGDASVTASYSPWTKGMSTLLYRLTVERPAGRSEVLVLYSGMASLLAGGGGMVFHVSEEKQGVISWYAMYRDEPAFADVKALVERVVSGDAKPLLAVRWPAGAKEGEMIAFDTKRLTN